VPRNIVPLFDDIDPETIPVIEASPFVWRSEASIPKRRWLYGKHLVRGFVSLDVAAGGVGKSSLKIGEAVAMASGVDIYGKGLPEGPLRVWLYNLEDPMEEIERRIHATAKRFNIKADDIGDRLFVNSGRDNPLILAEDTPNGATILRPRFDALEDALRDNAIDVLSLDPFVSAHALNENDNRAIDMVTKEISALSGRCDIATNVVHHIKKMGGQEANADSARGASSLVAAARSVVVYNRMTTDEAALAGVSVDQVGFYFRTANDKANLAPPEKSDWHRMNSVDLDNGDQVGVACPWQWPDVFAGVTKDTLRQVQRAVSEGQWRKDPRSSNWVGNIIANILSMDPEEHKKRIGEIVKQWIKTDVLREVEGTDDRREKRMFVEVGIWVTD
jgi:hypothetical protein